MGSGHRPAAPGRELPGGLRLPEPDPAGAVRTADLRLGPDDVVLVPALAAGRDGTRLGQGGGFYDRALADLPPHPEGPLVVAVVHDDELLAAGEVPSAPHDRRVDAVLTPSGWVAARASRPAASGLSVSVSSVAFSTCRRPNGHGKVSPAAQASVWSP